MTITTHTPEETYEIGKTLGGKLKKGDLLALIGDLGAGKTVFAKGVADGLGITQPVRSPTFALIHEYFLETPFYHIDLYRLESAEEISGLGLDEYFDNGICLIEWADRALDFLPEDYLKIELKINGENNREMKITAIGAERNDIMEAIKR